MTIIEQLEQRVTQQVLGDNNSISVSSLLDAFYAILIARLAQPQIYSQLLSSQQKDNVQKDSVQKDSVQKDSVQKDSAQKNMFAQLWYSSETRQTLIRELATTHHIDERTTADLTTKTTPLVYHALQDLADGQFLPAFLQAQQPKLRHYLPLWSAPIITAANNSDADTLDTRSFDNQSFDNQSFDNQALETSTLEANTLETSVLSHQNTSHNRPINNKQINSEQTNSHQSITADPAQTIPPYDILTSSASSAPAELPVLDDYFIANAPPDSTNALHANPSEHHNVLAANQSWRQKSGKFNWLWILLALALLLIIGLVWVLVTKVSEPAPQPPVVVAAPVTVPSVVAASTEPAELIVAVDNSGSLYNCSAVVGSTDLQQALQQALNTSFAEQASSCEIGVRQGVAESIPNLSLAALPDVFTMLRSVPFARLQLQSERVIVEAPDRQLLQALLIDIRNLIPTMRVETKVPLTDTNDFEADNVSNTNGMNAEALGNEAFATNPFDNSTPNSNALIEYQDLDDTTEDQVLPVPNTTGPNSNSNNRELNMPSNTRTPSGPISLSEVDDMTSKVIVAEPAQVN